jgi:plastocyanin
MKKTLLKLKLIVSCLLFANLPAAFAATNTVTFGSFFFNPSTVNIQAGDTVVWTASSPGTHTVTGTGADPICGPGGVGAGCSHIFNTPGSYPYICTVFGHASSGMTGLVVVAAAPTPATPALLTNMTMLPNGLSRFDVFSTAQRTNLVQATTNLASSNWTTISTVVTATTNFTVTDSNAPGFQLRFYRVVQP